MSEQTKKSKTGLSFLWGAVTGAVVGAVSALLFAPKKGVELRADIKDGTAKVVEASSQTFQAVAEKTSEVVKGVEVKAATVVEDTKHAFQKLIKKNVQVTSEIEDSTEKAQLIESIEVQQTEQEDNTQSIN